MNEPSIPRHFGAGGLFVLFACALAGSSTLRAQVTIDVSNTSQLINAVAQADAAGSGTTVTIDLAANTTFSLTSQLVLDSAATVQIVGNGSTLDGGGTTRLLQVESGTVNLEGITFQNGSSQGAAGAGTGNTGGGGGGGALGYGGAILLSGGNLTLTSDQFTSNTAQGGAGGGISGNTFGGSQAGGNGGGPNGGTGGSLGNTGANGGYASGGGGGGGNGSGGGPFGNGGTGGFGGGGGGGGASDAGGTGGAGAAAGTLGGHGGTALYSLAGGGGGGAGLGGAVFVSTGATLTLVNTSLNGDSAIGGNGGGSYGSGANGTGLASGLFLSGGTTQVSVTAGNTLTIDDTLGESPGSPSALTYQGPGSLILSGANTYSGGTNLQSGTLIAGNSGAFGSGLLNVSGGELTVGNNNHAIIVNSYAQSGGTLYLNVAGAGNAATADQLQVLNNTSSQAALGGNLTVNLGSFTRVGTGSATYTFNLVETNNGYTGAFTSFAALNSGLGLGASLDYTADDVTLVINQSPPSFPLTGLDPNQLSVLGPINTLSLAGNTSPGLTVLINALAPLSGDPATLGAALDELSPEKFSRFTRETAFNNASFATEQLDNYLASQRGPDGGFLAGGSGIDARGLTVNHPSADPNLSMLHSRLLAWNPAPTHGVVSDVAPPLLGGVEMKQEADPNSLGPRTSSHPWNVYVAGSVVLGQGSSSANVPHFDNTSSSVVLGVDYRITPHFLVGLTAGYGHTDATLDDAGSSATVDSYSAGLYASYADQGWYADLSGDYVHNVYTQDRVIGFLGQTAHSAPDGNEGVANLDGGYDFHRGLLTFGPLAGVQYTHLSVDGYNESGSVADLSVNREDSDSLRSRLGGRISSVFSNYGVNFMPHLDASWQHEFLDQSRGVTSQFNGFGGGSFNIQTENPSRDSALIDLGLDAAFHDTLTLFADYEVQAGQDNYFGQSVQAGMKIGF
jgi:uncharacterized protein YhjY with autotransporter beta-barrel domain